MQAKSPTIAAFLILLAVAVPSPSNAQVPSGEPSTRSIQVKVTSWNYETVRDNFLKACPAQFQQQAFQLSEDTRISAIQERASEKKYIKQNHCEVPWHRPKPPASEIHSERFQNIFRLDSPTGVITSCSDAVYARDVLSHYWPLLAITNVVSTCGFVHPAGQNPASVELQTSAVVAPEAPLNESEEAATAPTADSASGY